MTKEKTNQLINDIYSHNKYILNQANFLHFDDSKYLVFEIHNKGSNGGDCWGGRACDYYVNEEDQKLELANSISSLFSDYCKDKDIYKNFAEAFIYSVVTDYSDYCDPYGNGRSYNIINIPILELMKEILNKNDYDLFLSIFDIKTKEHQEELLKNNLEHDLFKLNEKLMHFEEHKGKEKQDIENSLAKAKKTVEFYEKSLTNFETNKENEANLLHQQKITIEKKLQKSSLKHKNI